MKLTKTETALLEKLQNSQNEQALQRGYVSIVRSKSSRVEKAARSLHDKGLAVVVPHKRNFDIWFLEMVAA